MLAKEVKKDKIYLLALILSGLFLPWVIISLKFLDFSFLLEEFFKLLVIFFLAYKISDFKVGFLGVFFFV